MPEPGSRSRNRAPVSCLSCKKRKVRCDRKRPCSGCVSNNVQHLCAYVEPNWVDEEVKKAASQKAQQQKDVRQSVEYLQLKAALETTIASQRSEIEALRAQLASKEAVNGAADFDETSGAASLPDEAAACVISILRKLDTTDTHTQTPEVLDNNFYSLRGFRHSKKSKCTETYVAKLYSWLNIIKLDPQLTGLWYKITSLQKSYHMYKTSLLSKYPRGGSNGFAESGCPVAASGAEHEPSCGHHQCPVVACEFNLMVEDSSNRGGTPMSRSPSTQARIKNENIEYPTVSRSDSATVLAQLQKLWNELTNYGRGSDRMNYDQLVYLVDFYLNLSESSSSVSSYELESRYLFRFYRDDILALFCKVGNTVELDFSELDVKVSEVEVNSFAKLKGVYLSMLGLIVEESLDLLRSRSGRSDDISKSFHQVFPLEAVHQGLGYKKTNVHDSIRDLLDLCSVSNQSNELNSSLACLSVYMGYLNRCISLYIKPGSTSDIRSGFSTILTRMLDMLDRDDCRLRLWADPSNVRFHGADMSANRQRELRLHLSHLWVDFTRLINHVTFGFVPLYRHSDKLDKQIESFFESIHEAAENHDHLKHVSKHKQDLADDQKAELMTSLHVYYLSSKIFLILRKSTCRSSGSSVTIEDLLRLTKEIEAWIEDFSLSKLKMSRYFEVRSMFHYLDFYISFVIFLQCEEELDYESACKILPSIFTKGLDLINFLKESVRQFSKNAGSQYILGAIAEILSRAFHLIVGLLIRFKRDEIGDNTDVNETPAPSSLVYTAPTESAKPFTISVQQKEQLIDATDSALMLLQNSLNRETYTRVSKMWSFYMTFVRSSHRMNPAAYARIHADVFKSGKLMDTCPVLPSPAKVQFNGHREVKQSGDRCPMLMMRSENEINKPMSPLAASSLSRSGSSMATSNSQFTSIKQDLTPTSSIQSRKRLCPFDHESLMSTNKAPSFQESNIRRSPSGTSPADFNPSKRTSQPSADIMPSFVSTQMPPVSFPMPPPSPSVGTMDWDTLPNFNFDLFPDETLMVQFGPGDLNNPNIEGMFQ